VTTGTVRKESTEEGKHGEGTMPNAGVENTEDGRCPIERGTGHHHKHHHQQDDTATYKIMERSLTSEENQYSEG
jgi:hypothetical protein